MNVFAKLFMDRLEWRLEAEAFSRYEIGGEDDVPDFRVGHLVDIDLTWQPAPQSAIGVFDSAQGAAFTSRSCSVPQSSQAHTLLDKSAIPFGREGGRHPHSEQTWVVRYSETSSVLPPFLMDLYESMRLKSDHPASSPLFAMVV